MILNKLTIISLTVFLFLLGLMVPSQSFADIKVTIKKIPGNGTLITYKMSVTASPEPSPLLKYRLEVPVIKRQQGNSVPFYLRPLGDDHFQMVWTPLKVSKRKNDFAQIHDFENSLDQVDKKKLADFAKRADQFTDNFLKKAALQENTDWGYYPSQLNGEEFITFPLPAVQHTRQIGRMLTIRTRISNAERDFEKSIETIMLGYKLAEDIKQSPFVVSQLIGESVESMTNECALDFISSPGSPNLYFALLTKNPSENQWQKSIQLDTQWILKIDPILTNLEKQKFTPKEWDKKFNEICRLFHKHAPFASLGGPVKEPVGTPLETIGKQVFPLAKKRLITKGRPKEEVESMPIGQVLLLDMVDDIRYFMQKTEVLSRLPIGTGVPSYANLQIEFENAKKQFRIGALIAEMFGPDVFRLKMIANRQKWFNKSLLVVEALRLHAASTGKFPKSLSELKWPAPSNPIDGKAFHYELKGTTAIIELPDAPGRTNRFRFEIELTKTNKKAAN